MNKQRKTLVLSYVLFLCVLALFFLLIVGYAISQKHITSYADFFQRATDTQGAVLDQDGLRCDREPIRLQPGHFYRVAGLLEEEMTGTAGRICEII